jgi:hypothetical protein
MRQYDMCPNGNPASRRMVSHTVVLQADLLRDFVTVIAAPVKAETAATKINRLNPAITVQGKTFCVSMAEMASVLRGQLGNVFTNG